RDWSAVRDHAQDVLALDPTNPEALAFLAAADRALGGAAAPPAQAPASALPISGTPPDQPTSFANGRYQVNRFLGEGGKKQVYLAHDSLLDREVAFALIKTEGLDDVSRLRVTREAQAMGRLGSHPHIVTVFDLGEHEGQPYMVTELMGGGDVEGVVEDAPEHRLPLEQAISIAVETCRGLEFAHSRGIVHRDLKPGNVWLTGDGVAKIGDFGLAVAIDRSRLTSEGMMVGTVSYMPPEQAMGGEVTPKADLYSLGAMLYEMVTGRPPFLGDDSVAIIGQHINTPPVAPTWHCSECPRPLEALILRLLAKDPAERPESATDVLAALDAVDLTVSAETSQPSEEGHALDSLAGGVFIGRQREMGELKAALEDALSGRGRLVTLVGEPGIGKTRTAQELATYAGLRQAQVIWGRCYEDQGVPPYWPWVQAIRSYVREGEPDQLRSELGSGAAAIAEIVSDVREQLPGLEAPSELEPEQARFRLFDSITTFLKSAGRRQPLVLMLDDLHWSDKPSLQLLEFVARELADARILLVGTYRDVELNRQHPLAETLGELTRERLFQRVLLRGLTQQDVARFVEVTSGIEPPRGMVGAVHQQTEGNPLFLTEVVRLLVQEGELTPERVRQRDSWSVRIPEGVREVIGRRLNRLSQRCNQTLATASVIGREFTLDQLKPLIDDLSEDRLLEVLEEALSARIIEEMPQAMARYQFTHALIQETLAGELTMTRKVRLHAQIAEALEGLYGGDAEAHATELAHHFAQAEAVLGTEKLVRYSLAAGERALGSYAHEEALAHYQRGLRAKGVSLDGDEPAADSQAADLLFGLGKAQIATTDVIQAADPLAPLRRAFHYYDAVGDVARALELASCPLPVYISLGRADLQMTERALALASPESVAAGRILARHGFARYALDGDYPGSQEALQQALTIARNNNDAPLELQALVQATTVDFWHVQWAEAREKGLRAVELARQVEDLPTQIQGLFYTATLLRWLGELEEARMLGEEALDLAEKLGDRSWLAAVLWLMGALAWYGGDAEEARECSDRALANAPTDLRMLGFRALLEYDTGGIRRGDTYLDQIIDSSSKRPTSLTAHLSHSFTPLAIGARARVAGVVERYQAASRDAAATLFSSTPFTPMAHYIAGMGLGLLAVEQRDTEEALRQYQLLLPGSGFHTYIAVHRVLGLLAHTTGELDKAALHFEDALALYRKGFRPELAWTCCDFADTLLQRNDPADRERAMSLLDESLAISTELGMRPLMERVLSRRDILKA
ncbi:MAG: serine/threonine-protein kinase PknK, partial [Dehalococcoidia bacterium]